VEGEGPVSLTRWKGLPWTGLVRKCDYYTDNGRQGPFACSEIAYKPKSITVNSGRCVGIVESRSQELAGEGACTDANAEWLAIWCTDENWALNEGSPALLAQQGQGERLAATPPKPEI
jgi:hypothetical protein